MKNAVALLIINLLSIILGAYQINAIANDYEQQGKDFSGAGLITLNYCIFVMVILFLQMCILCTFREKTQQLNELLHDFHHFLVSYRQTPRSRIFKRHLPQQIEPILEAESMFEQSQSRTTSII